MNAGSPNLDKLDALLSEGYRWYVGLDEESMHLVPDAIHADDVLFDADSYCGAEPGDTVYLSLSRLEKALPPAAEDVLSRWVDDNEDVWWKDQEVDLPSRHDPVWKMAVFELQSYLNHWFAEQTRAGRLPVPETLDVAYSTTRVFKPTATEPADD
jgi:hypothetical protein